MHLILLCSIGYNDIGNEGAKHVADMLAVNQTLTSVEYVTPHPFFPMRHRHESVNSP